MRILYISHSNNFTGSDLSLKEMIDYFNNSGHEIFLSLPYSKNKEYLNSLQIDRKKVIFIKPIIWHKIKHKNLLVRIKNFLYRIYKTKGGFIFTSVSLLLFVLKNKIEIIHSNSFVIIEGAIISKILNIPHIQHVREILNDYNSPFEFPFQKNEKFFCKMMSFFHSKVIFNSKFTIENAKNLFPKDKSIIIPNSFSDNHYKHRSLSSKLNRIGMISNVTAKNKNHLLFLKIAKESKTLDLDYKFLIYGKLPPSNDTNFLFLKSFIKKNNLESIVEFKGQEKDIEKMYSSFDILIHTHKLESFGRIYIESLIYKKPIIALKNMAVLELIINQYNGFIINEENEFLFIDAIKKLEKDKKFVTKITNNGFETALLYKSSIINQLIYEQYLSVK